MTNLERLEELAAMPDGWMDGEGKRITGACLRVALPWCKLMPSVPLFPTLEGGVQFEFYGCERWCTELEIDAYGRVQFIALEMTPTTQPPWYCKLFCKAWKLYRSVQRLFVRREAQTVKDSK